MSYADAIAALNDQFAQGDVTPDVYEVERMAIEYAHGEAMSAADERQGVAV